MTSVQNVNLTEIKYSNIQGVFKRKKHRLKSFVCGTNSVLKGLIFLFQFHYIPIISLKISYCEKNNNWPGSLKLTGLKNKLISIKRVLTQLIIEFRLMKFPSALPTYKLYYRRHKFRTNRNSPFCNKNNNIQGV